MSRTRPVAMVLGQVFDVLTMKDAIEDCSEALSGNQSRYFVTANLDFVCQSFRSPELKPILFNADRVFCDGMPLVWLSRLFKVPLPERIAGADLVPEMLEQCSKQGKSVFLLGCDPQTLEKLKAELPLRYPGLELAGAISPPYGAIDDWDNEAYFEEIRQAQPHLLLVALGFPKQEIWISRFRKQCGVPLSIGIGASLDFLVGKQRRAPKMVQTIGLEWCWRMMLSPSRLGPRYWKDLRIFLRLLSTHCRVFRPWNSRGEGQVTWKLSTGENPGLGSREEVVIRCGENLEKSSRELSRLFEASRTVSLEGKRASLVEVPGFLFDYVEEFRLNSVVRVSESPTPAGPRLISK